MTDKKFEGSLTPENFKDFILDLEKENLKKIEKDDKKVMFSKIMRNYEEAKRNDNWQHKDNQF